MAQHKKRIVVVANKSWEADPLVSVLMSPKAAPRDLGEINVVNHPVLPRSAEASEPRVEISVAGDATRRDSIIEIWCLQDLMNPDVSSSSTTEKARVLGKIKSYSPDDKIDLLVAFGTAGFPGPVSMNGSVVIGSKVFVHNPYFESDEMQNAWLSGPFDTLVDSEELPRSIFRRIHADTRYPAEGRFLLPPIGPASPPLILAGDSLASLGIVNVTNYDHYIWADAQAIGSFNQRVGNDAQIGSMETTHGLIRIVLDAPFIFVSGIADQIGRFDFEVTPRVYSQNFVAAHNAGLSVAWMLKEIVRILE